MNSKYYRLNQDLDANKILHDIKSMIQDHSKINRLEDTILRISITDITHTQNEDVLSNDRKNALPE
jgi:excinuclease UvrABC nuclease subunit